MAPGMELASPAPGKADDDPREEDEDVVVVVVAEVAPALLRMLGILGRLREGDMDDILGRLDATGTWKKGRRLNDILGHGK